MANANKINDPLMEIEQRIELLESRDVFQEDTLEQLNKELAIHQKQISEMTHQLQLLTAKLKEASTSDKASDMIEPPPPHY